MSRGSSLYPLWIGLVAATAFTWLLWPVPETGGADAGRATAVKPSAQRPDAAPDAAPSSAAEGIVSALSWRVLGRAAPRAEDLARCLADLGYAASVAGLGELTVAWRGALQTLTPDDTGWRLTTPVQGRCHEAAAIHVATASCLRVEGATLLDPHLGRRVGPQGWPRPARSGGLALHALVQVDGRPPRTRGLDRLGLPELSSDGPPRDLQRAAAAMVVACDPNAETLDLLDGGRATLSTGAGGLRHVTLLRPAARRGSKPPAPAPAPRRPRRDPPKPPPVFLPDYR